jgi:hypothetical protein
MTTVVPIGPSQITSPPVTGTVNRVLSTTGISPSRMTILMHIDVL